jgi:hypothetical protein
VSAAHAFLDSGAAALLNARRLQATWSTAVSRAVATIGTWSARSLVAGRAALLCPGLAADGTGLPIDARGAKKALAAAARCARSAGRAVGLFVSARGEALAVCLASDAAEAAVVVDGVTVRAESVSAAALGVLVRELCSASSAVYFATLRLSK